LKKRLSNLYPYSFEFEGVNYASMEAFFGTLRTPSLTYKQKLECTSGIQSWYLGHKFSWYEKQEVYYKDKAISRHSTEYDKLIRVAFDALFTNEDFKQALRESGDCKLTHTIGKTAKDKTLLTQREFVGHLNRLRKKLYQKKFYNLMELFE